MLPVVARETLSRRRRTQPVPALQPAIDEASGRYRQFEDDCPVACIAETISAIRGI
jgi:hypothetical protein